MSAEASSGENWFWGRAPWLRMTMAGARCGKRGRRGRRGSLGRAWFSPRGGGPRARRGEVRLAILYLLGEEPMHGYQMMQELEERSGGTWTVSPGSVYPTLQQLEDEGLVESTSRESRRVYSLTEAGLARLAKLREKQPAPPWEQVGGDGSDALSQLRNAAVRLGGAAFQVAQSGSPEEIEKARQILDQARRSLYQILAQED